MVSILNKKPANKWCPPPHTTTTMLSLRNGEEEQSSSWLPPGSQPRRIPNEEDYERLLCILGCRDHDNSDVAATEPTPSTWWDHSNDVDSSSRPHFPSLHEDLSNMTHPTIFFHPDSNNNSMSDGAVNRSNLEASTVVLTSSFPSSTATSSSSRIFVPLPPPILATNLDEDLLEEDELGKLFFTLVEGREDASPSSRTLVPLEGTDNEHQPGAPTTTTGGTFCTTDSPHPVTPSGGERSVKNISGLFPPSSSSTSTTAGGRGTTAGRMPEKDDNITTPDTPFSRIVVASSVSSTSTSKKKSAKRFPPPLLGLRNHLPRQGGGQGARCVSLSSLGPDKSNRQEEEKPFPTTTATCSSDRSSGIMVASSSPPVSMARFRIYQEDQWMSKYEDLKEFVKREGHTFVPFGITETNALARWTKRQRYQFKLRHKGNKGSTMTDTRVTLLEELGFIWNSHISTWDERLVELKQYKQEKGDCNVPSQYPANQKLATWVKCQRRQYKLLITGRKSNMSMERTKILENIGFVWELRCHLPRDSSSNNKNNRKERVLVCEEPLLFDQV